MATVRYTHVSKVYSNGFRAVSDFHLDIQDKEFLILVGPSGCGKSTTMRMCAGLEEISEGSVEIGGRVVNDLQPKDRNVAMVFQDYALYPHLRVDENMSLSLRLKKVPADEIQRRVAWAADVLKLTEYLDRYPRQLSGGQRQRVALGRAIVRTPDVFLFDEPLSNLDPKLRTTMRVELKQLHQRLDATMIYVTHDQIEAMTLGDRIVVLDKGVIQQVDDPVSLYERPANKFVAAFIGSPPMNFFAAELEAAGDALFAKSAGFRLRLPAREGLGATLRGHFSGEPGFTLGVRAEDMRIAFDGSGDNRFKAKVQVTEPVGAEVFIHLILEGEGMDPLAFVLREQNTTGARVRPGEQVSVEVDIEQVHLFDNISEKRIG